MRGRVPEHTGGGFEAVVRAVLVVVHNLEEKHHRLRVLLEALLQQLRNPHHGSANGGTASGDTTTRALGRYLLVRLDPLDDAGDGLENRLAQLVDVLHHLEIRLIDTDALAAAVRSGQISGAALDVFEKEPIPLDSPLRSLPTVVLTPHISWYSEESYGELKNRTIQNVVAVLEGRRPRNIINPEGLR